jgi:para-aminobenzoate synthetase/4-amino-4-deoxychorismate lyase
VHHDGHGIYGGIEGPLLAGRYHSLVLTDLPSTLMPTAHSGDGTLMGIRHRIHPIEGIQVHPESILTPRGSVLLSAFLEARTAPSGVMAKEIPENSPHFAS